MKIRSLIALTVVTSILSLARAQSPAILSLQMSNGNARLNIIGMVSNACTVQYATNLMQSNPWHYQANFQLTNTPALFLDSNQPPASGYFYRVFTQQLPTNVVSETNMIWI